VGDYGPTTFGAMTDPNQRKDIKLTFSSNIMTCANHTRTKLHPGLFLWLFSSLVFPSILFDILGLPEHFLEFIRISKTRSEAIELDI
jgi:hypothetical protein